MMHSKNIAMKESAMIIAENYAFARITNICRISSIII